MDSLLLARVPFAFGCITELPALVQAPDLNLVAELIGERPKA